jgi:hypothetical protein
MKKSRTETGKKTMQKRLIFSGTGNKIILENTNPVRGPGINVSRPFSRKNPCITQK